MDSLHAARWAELHRRQSQILRRLASLDGADFPAVSSAGSSASGDQQGNAVISIAPTQERLAEELTRKGVVPHAFVRVPANYYEQDLEWRRACLNAMSTLHLCKSIVMENTKLDTDVPGCPKNFCVIVQYAARLHAEKLKRHMHKQHKADGGSLGIKSFNMRLVAEDVSHRLTGFEHNAVTPIGSASPSMPIILSHRIAELESTNNFMWMGAGETDLKVGFFVQDFVKAYTPMVLDCTYDD